MGKRIAINGYGRIGRDLHRQILKEGGLEVVAINSRADASSHVNLLRHDSLYGHLDADVQLDGVNMKVNGKTVYVYQIAEPDDLPWKKHDVDLLVESTGKFTTRVDVDGHLKAGAGRVLITAPCKDEDVPNIVMGVNENGYDDPKYDVISNASCTTNCLAPVLKVLEDAFGIKQAYVTTIHAFTDTQNLLDNSNPKDFRRARSTTESIIPTTTGAMKSIGRVIPSLDGKVDGMAFRVPVPTVSCIDMSVRLGEDVSVDGVNGVFLGAEKGGLKGILGTTDEPLVSVDFRGDTRSAIVDLLSTKVMDDGFVKVVAWYDNEWGYVSRVLDLIKWVKV